MELFLSYPSKYRDLAERLRLALESEGHRTFMDRTELEPGQPFQQELREAIENCDVFVFLIAPESVHEGSYARAELSVAGQRWRTPGGRVLPVLIAPTPIDTIPPYLVAVTILQPQGDTVAETVAAVSRLRRHPHWQSVAGALVLFACVAASAYFWQQRRTEDARVMQSIGSASEVCKSGSFAAAWQSFSGLEQQSAGRNKMRGPLLKARADCAMQWLREIRVQVGRETFTDVVDRIQPSLIDALAGASGTHAADIHAHLGWAEYLRARDGAQTNPGTYFAQALSEDADNVYAHAMMGRLLFNHISANDETAARQHFNAALKSGREREFVRSMQFSGALSRAELVPYAIVVANDMRVAGERVVEAVRSELWRMGYSAQLFNSNDRKEFFALLSPTDHLATFEWLYPKAPREDYEDMWQFDQALLEIYAGDSLQGRRRLTALKARLQAEKAAGRLLDQTQQALR